MLSPLFPVQFDVPLQRRPLPGAADAIVDDAKMCFEL